MRFKILFPMVILVAVFATISFAQAKLTGAGSTFDYPIFSKWFDTYNKMTGVQINYSSIGSGGGIQQASEGTVDFGASDAPLTDQQMGTFKDKRGTEIIHLPIIMGGVAVTYNLPSVGKGLKLDGETLADIYLGKLKKWDDERIKKLNPGKNLPNKAILVTHRSDGSGTTFIFTNYLSKVSSEWDKKVGNSTSVNWPVGLGGKGSEGVSGLISQTEGAIGYVELAYAVKNNLPYALMKNKAGNFVDANFNTVTEAAAGAVKNMPKDLRAIITNADGKDAYPISGFSWIVVGKDIKNKEKAEALVKFLKWAVTKGQADAKSLFYSPLPAQVQKLDLEKINLITSNGAKVSAK
jgi:phosphate transport system substrate-binding protein